MAHFAEIKNGIVERVVVVHNDYEADGANYCANLFGGQWVQTSYNNNIRKQFAGVGYTYDATKDVFIALRPYPSWTLNNSFDWIAPTPYPNDGKIYKWDETTLTWILQN